MRARRWNDARHRPGWTARSRNDRALHPGRIARPALASGSRSAGRFAGSPRVAPDLPRCSLPSCSRRRGPVRPWARPGLFTRGSSPAAFRARRCHAEFPTLSFPRWVSHAGFPNQSFPGLSHADFPTQASSRQSPPAELPRGELCRTQQPRPRADPSRPEPVPSRPRPILCSCGPSSPATRSPATWSSTA